MPPAPIRRLRDYTRLRTDLTHDRSRQVQRLEKLLEDALIKISAVATDIMGVSGRAMIEALIAGQWDPKVLAGLARGRMKTKRAALDIPRQQIPCTLERQRRPSPYAGLSRRNPPAGETG